MKTRPIIIDACTLINLIRIDEDDMLYNYLLTFNIKIAECVYKEIKNNILKNDSSKGMREKVQLALVMSRRAKLYILDEPMGGVDPATRDYILDTILNNFDDGATIMMSTHLISDIERVLDEVIFIDDGKITRCEDADKLRKETGKSIDEVFREDFKC